MTTVTCHHCETTFQAQRRTRKFCSRGCANRSTWAAEKKRCCRECGADFPLRSSADANRQHCSRQCAKRHNYKGIKAWQAEHPDMFKTYRANQLAKDPDYDRKRWYTRRGAIIELLGGACVACGVTNVNWLHIDFIPGNRGSQYRHPRHYKYVSENRHLFRLLCANHHYELTLTGRIEGTGIIQ